MSTKVKVVRLGNGDAATVAEQTGYSESYIKKVAAGTRKNAAITNSLRRLFMRKAQLLSNQ